MNCVRTLLRLALVSTLALSGFAEDSTLAERLDREFAKLSSEDPAERDAAVEAIAKEGRPAEALVRERMKSEKDAEALGRLSHLLELIEIRELSDRRWEPVWQGVPITAGPVALALSTDGRLLAMLGEDATIALIDTATRKVLRSIDVGPGKVEMGLMFNGDGTVLVGVRDTAATHLQAWTTSDGRPIVLEAGISLPHHIESWRGPKNLVVYLRLSGPDEGSDLFWVADSSGVVDIARDRNLEAISNDGSRIVLSELEEDADQPDHQQLTVHVYDSSSGKSLREVKWSIRRKPSFGATLATDGSAVAVVDGGIIRTRSLKEESADVSFGTEARNIAWSGHDLIAAHEDGAIRWWRDGKMVREVRDAIGDLAWIDIDDGVVRAKGSEKDENGRERQRLAYLSAETGSLFTRLSGGGLSESSAHRGFVVSGPEGTSVFHAGHLVASVTLPPDQEDPWNGGIAFGGNLAVVGHRDRAVLHDLAAPDLSIELPRQGAWIKRLQWTQEGLVACGKETLALIDPATGKTLKSGRERQFEVAFGHCVDLGALDLPLGEFQAISADGTMVAVRSGTGILLRQTNGLSEARLLPIEGGPDVSKQEPNGPLAFSSDGSLLAARTSPRGFVDVWETGRGRRVARLGPFPQTIDEIAIAGEARTVLVTLDSDKESLRLFAPDGSALGKVDWPQYGGVRWQVNHGRNSLAREWNGPPILVVLDLREPTAPQRFELPGVQDFVLLNVHESPDGERVIIESGAGEIFAASCKSGFLRMLGNANPRREAEGVAGFLERGHAVVLTSEGLDTLFGPTWDELVHDTAVRGQALAVSPDGKRIAVANGARVTVYEAHSKK